VVATRVIRDAHGSGRVDDARRLRRRRPAAVRRQRAGSSPAGEKAADDRRDRLQSFADRIGIDPEGLQGRCPEEQE
jgi:hypothetical protein